MNINFVNIITPIQQIRFDLLNFFKCNTSFWDKDLSIIIWGKNKKLYYKGDKKEMNIKKNLIEQITHPVKWTEVFDT